MTDLVSEEATDLANFLISQDKRMCIRPNPNGNVVLWALDKRTGFRIIKQSLRVVERAVNREPAALGASLILENLPADLAVHTIRSDDSVGNDTLPVHINTGTVIVFEDLSDRGAEVDLDPDGLGVLVDDEVEVAARCHQGSEAVAGEILWLADNDIPVMVVDCLVIVNGRYAFDLLERLTPFRHDSRDAGVNDKNITYTKCQSIER